MSTYNDRMADPTPRTLKVTSIIEPRTTVSGLVRWCEEKGLNPDEVWMPSNHLCHNHTETPDEVALRLKRRAEAVEREREWVRERYQALFGTEEDA